MALTVKMGSGGKKLGDLKDGETVEGYLIGIAETKFNFAIKMLTRDGKIETYFPNGNLNYLETEIDEGNVALNAYTVITRTGTRTSTKSRDDSGAFRQVPVFQVAQDNDDVVTDEAAAEALAEDKAAGADDSKTSGSGKFANRRR
jgi:hypothetical protein